VNELKNHYMKDDLMKEQIEQLIIEGEDKFSVIRNIPDVEINGKKLISILTNDLIKLLCELPSKL
jgi:gluconate kinase